MKGTKLVTAILACFAIEALIIVSAIYMLERTFDKQINCPVCLENERFNNMCTSRFDEEDLSYLFKDIEEASSDIGVL